MKRLIRGNEIDHMVPDLRLIVRGGFVRADIHIPIDLHGIGADDLPPTASAISTARRDFPTPLVPGGLRGGPFFFCLRSHMQAILMNPP